MSKEESESPPVIFKETSKIIEALESREEKVFKLKKLLEHKNNYYEQLQQHDNETNKSSAGKRAKLAVLNNTITRSDMQNSKFRDEAKQIYDSCSKVYQDVNEMESSFAECEGKLENIATAVTNNTSSYENKIDNLIKLLDQLTEKRNKKLEFIEAQEKKYQEESLNLNKELSAFETMTESLVNDNTDDDAEIEMLENEFKELQSKLSILDEEYSSLKQEEKDHEIQHEEVLKKYDNNRLMEIENRFVEVNKEVSELSQSLNDQKETNLKLSNSKQTLEDYEKKLNEELQQKSKFFDEMEKNEYGGFSQIEQEISQIRADLIERNEKYAEAQNVGLKYIEGIKRKDEEIEYTSSLIDTLSSDFKKMEDVFENLKSSSYFTEQYDLMSKDIETFASEKAKLTENVLETENKINEILTKLKKDKSKNELEMLAMENTHSVEVKTIERDIAEEEAAKIDKEQKEKSVDHEIKVLEETRKSLAEMKAQIELDQKNVDKETEESKKNFQIFRNKKVELQKQLVTIPAPPPPVYVKENELSFPGPKPAPVIKKKITKKHVTERKRNWDSDSSIEGEVVMLTDFLERKKYKGRQDPKK